jgi:CBS domain-containing protein
MTATSSPKIDLRECLVADYMRQGIVGCAPDTPLSEVAQQMSDHRIHCVVVGGLEEGRRGTRLVWGVVSDLDLARAAAADEELTAGQVAATEPVTASLSDSLADVAHVMGEHDIAHLVVVDDRSEPIGVISTLDVACALAGRAV